MTVIGSAYVNIRAITDKLESDIRKALDSISDSVTIKVDADTSSAAKNIEALAQEVGDQTVHVDADTTAARNSFDDLANTVFLQGQHTINVDADTMPARIQIDSMADDIRPRVVPDVRTVLAEAKLRFLTRTREARINIKANEAIFKHIGESISKMTGARVLVDDVGELVQHFINIDKAVPGIAKGIAKFGTIGALAMSSVGGIMTLGASIGSVINMIGAAAPGMATGFIVGIGTMIVALKDFGKQLPDVVAKYKTLGGVIKENFWDVARNPIREMANTLFPKFQQGLALTARALGGWSAALADALKDQLGGQVLLAMFGNLSKSIDIAKGGLAPLVRAFVELGSVGGEYLPKLAQWFVDVSTKFGDFIAKAADTGDIYKWIDEGIYNLKRLGSLIGETAGVFSGITTAAKMAGSDGLGTLLNFMKRVNDAVNSPEGLVSLSQIFSGANSAAKNFGDGVFNILKALGGAAPAISSAFSSVAGIIKTISDALVSIISNPEFQQGFTELFAGVQKGFEALMPVLGTTGPKVGAFLSIIGNLAANIGGVLAAALEVTLPLITALKKAVDPLIPVLGDALIKIIQALSPLFSSLGDTITTIAPAVTEVVKVVADLVVGLVQGLGPALPTLVALVAAFVVGLKGIAIIKTVGSSIIAIVQLFTFLQKSMGLVTIAFNLLKAAFLANPIGIAVAAVAALVTGFVLAYNNIGWFKDGVDAAMKWIGDAIGNVVSFWNTNVVPMWNTAMQAAGDFFGAIGKWVSDAIGAIGDFFGGFGKGAGDAAGAMGDFFGGIGKGISDAFNGAVGFIGDVMTNIGNVIKTGVDNLVTNWTNAFNLVRDIFVNIWTGLITFFQPLIDLFGAIIKGAIDIFVAIWVAGWEIVSTIFYGIWINLVRFFTPVIDGIAASISNFINGVVAVWNTTWQAVSDFFVAVWNNLVAFVTPIIQGISDTITNVVNGIVSVWNTVWQGIVDYFTFVWNTMVAIYTPILQGISDFIGAVVNGISATWNAVWSGISGFFGAVWNGIMSIVQTYVTAVSSIIISVVSGISGFWNATWSAISGFVSGVWSGIVNGVSGFVNQVGSYIGNVLNRMGQIGSDIMGKVAGFPSLLVSAGTDLINGLVNGINNASGAVVRKIQEIASGALDAIKNFFGIKSPSRVMRDQVGKQIGAGLAIGIEASVGRVSKAVATLSEAAMMSVPDIQLPNITGGSVTPSGAAQPVLSTSTLTGQSGSLYNNYSGIPSNTNPASPNIMLQVNPSAALDEEKVGKIAATELYWQFVNR